MIVILFFLALLKIPRGCQSQSLFETLFPNGSMFAGNAGGFFGTPDSNMWITPGGVAKDDGTAEETDANTAVKSKNSMVWTVVVPNTNADPSKIVMRTGSLPSGGGRVYFAGNAALSDNGGMVFSGAKSFDAEAD